MPALRSEELRTQVRRAVNGRTRESEYQISAGQSSHFEDASALKNFSVSFVLLEDLNAMCQEDGGAAKEQGLQSATETSPPTRGPRSNR